jgi:hypothetical protein
MPTSVNLETAARVLANAWKGVEDSSIQAPTESLPLLETIIHADDVTFKYILVTGLLGKATQGDIHPRALQTSSRLRKSYDARSLCHKVVVPFEKSTRSNLWGLSNEPFVNKPARHPEHSKDNPQLRNKALAEQLHDVLDIAIAAGRERHFECLSPPCGFRRRARRLKFPPACKYDPKTTSA